MAEVEEEIMLRDTFELFDVDQRGGLDADLLGLLMNHVSAVWIGCVLCLLS